MVWLVDDTVGVYTFECHKDGHWTVWVRSGDRFLHHCETIIYLPKLKINIVLGINAFIVCRPHDTVICVVQYAVKGYNNDYGILSAMHVPHNCILLTIMVEERWIQEIDACCVGTRLRLVHLMRRRSIISGDMVELVAPKSPTYTPGLVSYVSRQSF